MSEGDIFVKIKPQTEGMAIGKGPRGEQACAFKGEQ